MSQNKLKLFDLVSIGVGSIIGAGIFSMLMMGLSMTGRSIALALAFAMLVVFLQGIKSLFLSSMFALEGGMYAQQALILPPIFTGTTAITYVVSNMSMSVFGISIAQYLSQLIPALAPYQTPLGILIVTLAFLLTYKGAGALAKVQNLMAVCMYVALALFVFFGLKQGGTAEVMAAPYFAAGPMGFLMATAIMSFACNGGVNIMNLAGSAENPRRNIPLAFLLAEVICTVIYFLLGHVAGSVVPMGEAATSTMGTVAQQVMPHGFYVFFVVGGAIFALATSLLGGLASMSAPIVAGAEDGWLPAVLAKRGKNGSPYAALLLMYAITVIPVIGKFSLDSIVSFILVPGMFVNVVSLILCFKIPKKFPKEWDNCALKCPYWFYCLLIILSIAASLITAIFSMMSQTMAGIIGNIAMTVFLFGFSYWRLKSGKVELKSIQSVTRGDGE